VTADLGDPAQIDAAIAQTLAQFGAIHGVIHAAGVAGGGLIQLKTSTDVAKVMAPKVDATLTLASLLPQDLDFFVLCSSQSSILGEFGQVDYCAANAFLDAFAAYQFHQGVPTLSINWDTWQEVGMGLAATRRLIEQSPWHESAAGSGHTAHAGAPLDLTQNVRMGITSAEGCEAFLRILDSNLPQVIVATREFSAIREQSRNLTTGKVLQSLEQHQSHGILFPRPNLSTPYVAPTTDIQGALTDIWCHLIGVAKVGIHDHFLELGGNSLLGTQVAAQVHEKLQVHLPLAQLFSTPTIAGLSEYIETTRWVAGTSAAVIDSNIEHIEGEL
jgi:hypothetical protein